MNEEKLNALVGQLLQDLGGGASTALVRIGDQLGIYKALQNTDPMTSTELAEATGLAERYLREWLSAQAASGYVSYDPNGDKFSLSPEQSAIFADEDSPAFLTPAFDAVAAYLGNQDAVAEGFKTGAGIGWGNQTECLFCAVAKFFRPGYKANLVGSWLPALDGVVEKLERGIKVADVGCGHGISTVIMAEAFPNSQFTGFDFHEGSIIEARGHAKEHGLDNLQFETSLAKEYPGKYDLVCIFDCLHDMGDPAGAMAHVHSSLASEGTCMVVEPQAGDSLADNLNPIGRLFYSASTMVCVPTSLSQEVGAALGAQAGETRLREVMMSGGFSNVRRATETPFNMVLELRP
jgi:hypothetical protein